jgi:eukaryotic-like serine/threonine-protein kinase
MEIESNLLFAVLAMQADLIDDFQFWEALRHRIEHVEKPLADLLVERQWISVGDRHALQQWQQRKVEKYGTIRAALAACPGEEIPLLLEHLDAPEALLSAFDHSSEASPEFVQNSADGNAKPMKVQVLVSSLTYHAGTRDRYERYSLTSLHATGGVGRVWLARDAALGRNVALKELRPEFVDNPALWSRFLQEARITGQLQHPGIVPVYELKSRAYDHQPFYTMRFVEGRTLSEAVDSYHKKRATGEAGPLDLRSLLGAFIGVCNAVGYAHSRHVVHRDLKSLNVIVGDFGEVMVLDWGLAKVFGSEELASIDTSAEICETHAGQILGTPAYMAPEQAAGQLDRIGPRTDVYGLGAILYEILTGRAPFSGDSVEEVLAKVCKGGPPPPLRSGGAGTAALEAICLRAMATRAEDRYGSARELADEVDRWLADEPVRAFREPLAARLARWVRRHRPVVAGAVSLLATATIALAVGLTVVRVEQQRTDAARAQAVAYASAADTQRRRAEANSTRAREIVDEIVRRAGDTPMGSPREEASADGFTPSPEPGSGGGRQYRLRRALLEDALKFYQGFLVQENADAAIRREIEHAYRKIGDIYGVLGKCAEATQAYAAAAAIQGSARE